MGKKKTALLITGLCLGVLLVALLIAMRTGVVGGDDPLASFRRTESGAIILTPASDADDAGEAADGETASGTEPDLAEAAAPEQETSAEDDYFADAAFVGNETVAALKRYDYEGLLTQAAFYEVDSVEDTSFVKQIKRDGGCGKLYIGLGGGEMSNRVDDLRDSIAYAIDTIRGENPDCIFYLMSVSPVSKYRESVSRAIRMDRLPEYNEMLQELAAEKGAYYLDITSVLVDEEGYLPSDVTEDGMNFTPAHYAAWYAQIASHYIGES